MKIIKKDKVKIETIVEVLKKGGLVILPTETVYIASVDATNRKTVKNLAKYKNRPFGKPYSVAVSDQKMAEDYVELNDTARNLYKTFLPGPVTIISKGLHKVAPGVESETGTLGIRIPDYGLVLDIVKTIGKPITATSANASYQKRPYKIDDVLENLSEKQKELIDLVVDAGELPHNEPSTVIDTTLDDPVVLRQGDIKFKSINEITSRSPEGTQNIAKELWQKYEQHQGKRAIVFALEGPMGAGKTEFTKGLARAMGIKEEIVSPTYDLAISYQLPAISHQSSIKSGRPSTISRRLVHFDAWRIQEPKELENLGFIEEITDKSVLAIEWADRVTEVIRKQSEEAVIIWVKIKYPSTGSGHTTKENERLVSWGVL